MPLKQSTLDFAFVPVETPENKTTKPEQAPARQTSETSASADEPVVLEDEVIFKPAAKSKTETKNAMNTDGTKKSPRGRMRLSDMNASAELIEVPEDKVLFEKSYYSIGAVSDMFKVKPKKNAKGDRFFRPEDVKNLKLIYHLLRERKYTIEGAKEFLKKNKNADKKFEMIESLKNLKSFLFELKANL